MLHQAGHQNRHYPSLLTNLCPSRKRHHRAEVAHPDLDGAQRDQIWAGRAMPAMHRRSTRRPQAAPPPRRTAANTNTIWPCRTRTRPKSSATGVVCRATAPHAQGKFGRGGRPRTGNAWQTSPATTESRIGGYDGRR
jgi:hypothetical protein